MISGQAAARRIARNGHLALLIVASMTLQAAAQDTPSEADDARLHIRDTGLVSIAGIVLKTGFPEKISSSRSLDFDLELISATALGEIEAVLEITDGDVQIAEVTLRTSVFPGITPMRVGWMPQDLPDGHYDGTITIAPVSEKVIVKQSFDITKRSRVAVEAMLKRANDAVTTLQSRIYFGKSSAIVAARLSVAADALSETKYVSAGWFRSYDIAERVLHVTYQLEAEMALVPQFPEGSVRVDLPALGALGVARGGFTLEGRPVFLGGIATDIGAGSFERIARYGLNFGVFRAATPLDLAAHANLMRGEGEGIVERGFALAYVLPVDGRSSVEVTEIARVLAPLRGLVTLALEVPREIDIASPALLDEFVGRVKQTYTDRFELNRIWRRRLVGFGDIEIWPDFERPAYQYDWQTFRQDKLDARVSLLANAARVAAPGVALSFAFDGSLLRPGASRQEVDQERASAYGDRNFLVTSSDFGDPTFGTRYPTQAMLYTLRRAFDSDAPLIVSHKLDFRNPANWYGRDTSRDIETFVWEAAIEGVGGLALDLSGLANRVDLPATAALEILDGLTLAAYDVNRLAPIVEAFRMKEASVAIVWSDSSRIFDDGEEHLGSLRRAYSGTSFAGYKLRFLTERQLERRELDGIELLVVPHTPSLSRTAFRALQEVIDSGLPMIRSSNLIPYDSRGMSQDDVITYGPRTVLVRGNDISTEYMESMDESIARDRLPTVTRAVNRWGYPIEGLKTRHITYEGEDYLYLVNLRKDPVVCDLSVGTVAGQDLIRGEDVSFPMSVEPLRPMLIRLDKVELASTDDTV